ncbi:hypothetical protein K439DRAFT_1625196 [Ramaria rubella]|nr:hypothetical protein K439DRAFT_1625196 [Ramaria rubella]
MTTVSPRRFRTATALRLSHVCRHWRRVAQDDALLWTQIELKHMELAKRFVGLCKDAPIHLFIEEISRPVTPRFGVQDAIELMQSHFYHVQYLEISMNLGNMLDALSVLPSFTRPTAPRLTRITINVLKEDPTITPPIIDFVPNTPLFLTIPTSQICDISFMGLAPPNSSTIWDNRRSLSLHNCNPEKSFEEYMALISRSPELRSLSISSEVSHQPSPFVSSIAATHLTFLHLDKFGQDHIFAFLQRVDMPNLKTLHLDVHFYLNYLPLCTRLFPESLRSTEIFRQIHDLEHECGVRRDTWRGTGPSQYEVILTAPQERHSTWMLDGLFSLFSQLQSLTLSTSNQQEFLFWNREVSSTVRTLRVKGRKEPESGNECQHLLRGLAYWRCLPNLECIILVAYSFPKETHKEIWRLVETLTCNSQHPSLYLTEGTHLPFFKSWKFHMLRKYIYWVKRRKKLVSSFWPEDIILISHISAAALWFRSGVNSQARLQ